jgi:hypothetical protein
MKGPYILVVGEPVHHFENSFTYLSVESRGSVVGIATGYEVAD